jgi:hypothetical protein
MYPREEEEAAGNGLYWFNYWSPTEKNLLENFEMTIGCFSQKRFIPFPSPAK